MPQAVGDADRRPRAYRHAERLLRAAATLPKGWPIFFRNSRQIGRISCPVFGADRNLHEWRLASAASQYPRCANEQTGHERGSREFVTPTILPQAPSWQWVAAREREFFTSSPRFHWDGEKFRPLRSQPHAATRTTPSAFANRPTASSLDLFTT